MSIECGTIKASEIRIRCIVCGEDETLEGYRYLGHPIICKKCKAAVMKVRKEMEDE